MSWMGHKCSLVVQVISSVFRMVQIRDKFKLSSPFRG